MCVCGGGGVDTEVDVTLTGNATQTSRSYKPCELVQRVVRWAVGLRGTFENDNFDGARLGWPTTS